MSMDSNARPRVLFLTHRVPYPPDKGDRIRSWNILRYLALRYDVWLGCLADEDWSPATERLLQQTCSGYHISRLDSRRWVSGLHSILTGAPLTFGMFQSADLHRWVRQTVAQIQFDAVVAYCSSMLPYTAAPQLRGRPVIVDLVDVDSQKWDELSQRSGWLKAAIYQREARLLRKVEQGLGRTANAVILVTDAEAALYRRNAPDARIVVAGNGVDVPYFQRPATEPSPARDIVFVGALDYSPNIDGILWFADEVWPEVRSELPDVQLRIVGRRPSRAIRSLENRLGIHVHGNVPDVRPFLFGATAAIVPLKVARGIQNKILEALACDTPVIATPEALTGTELVPGRDVLSATSRETWASAVTTVFQDKTVTDRLRTNGRQYILKYGNWNEQLAPLGQLLHDLICETRRRNSASHEAA